MGCGVVRGRASPSKIDSAAAEPLTLAVTRSYRRGSCSDYQPSRGASRVFQNFSVQPRGSADGRGRSIDKQEYPSERAGFLFTSEPRTPVSELRWGAKIFRIRNQL